MLEFYLLFLGFQDTRIKITITRIHAQTTCHYGKDQVPFEGIHCRYMKTNASSGYYRMQTKTCSISFSVEHTINYKSYMKHFYIEYVPALFW